MTLHTLPGRFPRTGLRVGLAVAAAASLVGLAACGTESTVTDDGSSTSASSSSSADSTVPSDGGTAVEQPTSAGETPTELPEDYPGPGAVERSEKDKEFLSSLKDQGVTVDGVEDTLIGVGNQVCRAGAEDQQDRDVIVNATAGQLVAQGATDKDAAATATILRDTAAKVYCP